MDSDGVARFDIRIRDDTDMYLAATAEGFQPTAVRVVSGDPHPFRDHRLRPGDILLCQGNTLISAAITIAERTQLAGPNPLGRPWYSHVALYLGEGKSAEMLSPGLVTHTILDTADGCTTLDVYRLPGVAPKARKRLIEFKNYGHVPYAWGQIAAMASMAAIAGPPRVHLRGPLGFIAGVFDVIRSSAAGVAGWVAREVLQFVNGSDHGRLAMICSEFIAWRYFDSDIPLEVAPWWPVVADTDLLRTLDGRMDFTTPNMIAQSPDLAFQFQLYPEVPPEVALESCEIRLGEKIEFETGSADIDDRDVDLLEAVLGVLIENPDISHLRVEGNTDDVGRANTNLRLSEARADAVMGWMIAHGVEASRVSSVGWGETRPLVSNDSAAERHENRRVEFHIESQACK